MAIRSGTGSPSAGRSRAVVAEAATPTTTADGGGGIVTMAPASALWSRAVALPSLLVLLLLSCTAVGTQGKLISGQGNQMNKELHHSAHSFLHNRHKVRHNLSLPSASRCSCESRPGTTQKKARKWRG